MSSQYHLYHHQLAQCNPGITLPTPSDEAIHEFEQLRHRFARQVKRNLFDAYLRPRETVISLVSTSISSSAAFPGGEAFHFSFSANGWYILAWSSSRIYLLNTTASELMVERELKIVRRPASVTIVNDGSMLGVLSSDHQVDLYELRSCPPKHIRVLALDNAPRTIAISPEGAVLAAAFDGGVEVYSLSPEAAITDRRAVKCDATDSLTFSNDGTELLGTTIHSKNPSTVILTAPYFDPGDSQLRDTISQLWTTSIIFPNSSRDCSHAILLPSSPEDESNWSFTYDRVFETFRTVRIDDLRNGTTYFTGPVSNSTSATKLLPCTLPCATKSGDLVAAGFQDEEIWVYGVPEDKTAIPEIIQTEVENFVASSSVTRMNSSASSRSHTWPRDGSSSGRIPQWQVLCDKNRNMFIEGRRIGSLGGVSAVKWVGKTLSSNIERLVAVAPGVLGNKIQMDEDGIPPTDGGRLLILDFEYGTSNGTRDHLTIEVGLKDPEVLEEEYRDMETEVAIYRRRTVAQKRGGRNGSHRSITHDTQTQSELGSSNYIPPTPQRTPTSPMRRHLSHVGPRSDSTSVEESDEVMDMPYAQGQPRSADVLRRAATAAAINRRLHPPRAVAQEDIVFRRADGREEHPHESDADNWVPPPPPYSPEPIAPLPEHLRNSVLAGNLPVLPNLRRSSTQRTNGSGDSDIFSSLARSRTTYIARSGSSRVLLAGSRPRSVSVDSTRSFDSQASIGVPSLRHSNLQGNFEDDIYDVSPPSSPNTEFRVPQQSATTQAAPRPLPSTLPQMAVGMLDQEIEPQSHNIPTLASVDTLSSTTDISVHNSASPNTERQASLTPPQPSSPNSDSAAPPGLRMISSVQPVNTSTSPQTSRNNDAETKLPSGSDLVRDRLNAQLPPQPNGDHHMAEPPTLEPDLHHHHSPKPSPPSKPAAVVTATSSRPRSDTAPASLPNPTASEMPLHEPPVATFDGPSAVQLARLSSRSGRPNSRVLTDPSRRSSLSFSGTFGPQNPPPNQFVPSIAPSRGMNPVEMVPLQSHTQRASMQRLPTQDIHETLATPPNTKLTSSYPQISMSASRTSDSSAGQFGFNSRGGRTRREVPDILNSPNARLGMNGMRHNASSPNLRPRHPGRMDTIHSITSNGDAARQQSMGTDDVADIALSMVRSKGKANRKRHTWSTRKERKIKEVKGAWTSDGSGQRGSGDWSHTNRPYGLGAADSAKRLQKKERRCIMM